ncbi:PREDICTED: mitosis initiation protein fs(1)Ya [Drosophila arizonae]|uniref:Mitosis initiation protein fs(1)Ya n=1 Tax=Drosophila arizonae TaxID=7263 RepID=A0ABM1PT55_DROAR|nr:PREDICTED: mitosis initiation protein fs(1)Ya [Drosophila arizonae]
MRFSDEVKCHICKRIFCCGKCRQKHQFEAHAIAVTQPIEQHSKMVGLGNDIEVKTSTIYVFCPICEQKPLTLRKEMYAELLAHIESVHLPLRCRKCLRHYTKIDDLKEFSKCVDLGQNCSAASTAQNATYDTEASKVTVKKATVAANTISTQTSPHIAKEMDETHQHLNLTPISLFNIRWKAKGRLTQEEFISDSVSSIRNLSSESVNLSGQQRRSIGQVCAQPDSVHCNDKIKGKVIRSTSTPLQVYTMFAKPKEPLTFNASSVGGGQVSSIYHSGYALDEPNSAPDSSHLVPPQHQRTWKVGGRGKMSAVTPLRQVMSKSIQKAFVEHGAVGMLPGQSEQRRMRLDLNEVNRSPNAALPLDLRLSPVVRRTQSDDSSGNRNSNSNCNSNSNSNSNSSSSGSDKNHGQESKSPESYQILLSAQKLTRESIIITRTQHAGNSVSLIAAAAGTSTTSTVYNSCESVEIITSSTSTAELSTNLRPAQVDCPVVVPPITPITSVPGAIINKKLIKFETPLKPNMQTTQLANSTPDEKEIFYTPNPSHSPLAAIAGSPSAGPSNSERRRQQIVPRQLSGQFMAETKRAERPRPQGPRARPPLRVCHHQKSFSCVQDIGSDDEDEIFLPNSASTQNDKKRQGRLWSLVSSVMRLPQTLRTDPNSNAGDKENIPSTSNSGSLIRRCASIAGSLVRTIHSHDDADLQSLKRKRTQTLDNASCTQMSPSNSSKRLRIQARKPIERMRNN